MTQQAEAVEYVYTAATSEETVADLARVMHGRYHTVSEDISAALQSVTTPQALVDVLAQLHRRLGVRLAFIPTPPTTQEQRVKRQTFEGRRRKLDEEISLVKKTFNLK